MGSVLDYIECPNCKGDDCSSDFYYKTGEEYLFCGECGYHKSVSIADDSRSKKLNELSESDWNVEELSNPWGAYRLKEKGMVATQCGSFASREEYGKLLSLVEKHIDEIDEFVVSRFVDGKITKFSLFESDGMKNEMI